MKNLLKCSSLIRVAVLMVVMVFMASQMTGAYADKPHKGKPHKKIKLDEHDADIKEGIAQHDTDAYNNIVTHDDNMTREHRSLSNQHGDLDMKLDVINDKLDQCIENGNGNGADCDVCPPPAGITKSWVAKTGQTPTIPFNPAPTGSDGYLEKGVDWPNPRFTINLKGDGTPDGTVTDNLTCLIWDRNADRFGEQKWNGALSACNSLTDGAVGLTDGSVEGEWRLANRFELESLLHLGVSGPAVPNTSGTGQWVHEDPFINVQSARYWSSTTSATSTATSTEEAWEVNFGSGVVLDTDKTRFKFCWCVRGGQ
jgi:hypothetical protein